MLPAVTTIPLPFIPVSHRISVLWMRRPCNVGDFIKDAKKGNLSLTIYHTFHNQEKNITYRVLKLSKDRISESRKKYKAEKCSFMAKYVEQCYFYCIYFSKTLLGDYQTLYQQKATRVPEPRSLLWFHLWDIPRGRKKKLICIFTASANFLLCVTRIWDQICSAKKKYSNPTCA